jgi:hypothetical protein
MCRYTNQQFMQQARKDKNQSLSNLRINASPDQRRINMPLHKMINGFIPTRPVDPHTRHIPPIAVKFAIAEPHHFGQCVQKGLEEGKETSQPAEERYCAEFHDSFGNGYEVEGGNVVEGVLKEWHGVLGGCNPDYDAEASYLCQALYDKSPSYAICAWVDWLIDECRRPPEVGQVSESDVTGIWAALVQLWKWCRCIRVQV